MSKTTRVPSRKQAKEFFEAVDINKDMKIDHRELVNAMERMYGVDSKTATSWFADVDRDGSKTLTYDEFVNEICKTPRSEAIKDLFDKADKDDLGKLSFEELKNCCEEAGFTDLETLEEIFGKYDKDGSGCLDREEFIKLMNAEY